MKDKVLFLIIGILIGAMVTTGVFMIINKNTESDTPNIENFRTFNNGEMPEGFDPENLPEDFDFENMPEGGMPGGGRRNNSNSSNMIEETETESI